MSQFIAASCDPTRNKREGSRRTEVVVQKLSWVHEDRNMQKQRLLALSSLKRSHKLITE